MNSRAWRAVAGRTSGVAGVGAVVLAAALLAPAGGCYSRVVGARGPGADQYSVSEPYQQDSRLDRWFYGDRTDRRNRSLLNERGGK